MLFTLIMAGGAAVSPIIFQLAIFVLAIFVGYYVVWSVSALVAVAAGTTAGNVISTWTGTLAAALCAVNIFGGFLVTQRMLAMYKKKDKPASKKVEAK